MLNIFRRRQANDNICSITKNNGTMMNSQPMKVAILGSGTMGRQLSLLFASAKIDVTLWNHAKRPGIETDLQRMALFEARRLPQGRRAGHDGPGATC